LPAGNLSPPYLGLGNWPNFTGSCRGKVFLQNQNAQLEQKCSNRRGSKPLGYSRAGNQNSGTDKIKRRPKHWTVFNQIRPWSAMLQDIRDRTPRAVQIETLSKLQRLPSSQVSQPNQPPPSQVSQPQIRCGIELSGVASSRLTTLMISYLQQSPSSSPETKSLQQS